ncbi:MAG: GNAT family N-acetyltransferase [Solirubrobacterales bacterium]
MGDGLQIAPLAPEELEELLPLIGDYQRFYRVDEIDEERNRAFFRRFVAPSESGMLLAAQRDGELIGYACLYWTFTSLVPAEMVLMNDLFVSEEARGAGVGRALIEAAVAVASERGAHHLEWATEPDNSTARALYDRTGAEREEWIVYELPT